MAWRFRPTAFPILQDLSALTARLIRLGAYQQLERGQTQIQASGLPADLTGAYKNFVIEEQKIQQEQEKILLTTHTTSRSTF